MKLTLKNIGKVSEATIAIDGITVIAGENNTGKSTVSKSLFSIFNGFYDVENQVRRARIQSIVVAVERILFERHFPTIQRNSSDTFAAYIIDNAAKLKDGGDIHSLVASAINQHNEKFNKSVDAENIPEGLTNRITEIISVDDRKILDKLLRDRLEDEFDGQVNNIYTEEAGEIILTIKNTDVSIKILDNEICGVSCALDLWAEAIYIDDPFVVDEVRSMLSRLIIRPQYGHRSHLKNMLLSGKGDLGVVNELIATVKFDAIFEKTELSIEVPIVSSRRPVFEAGMSNGDKPRVAIKNLSTGIKTFLILKTLLTNGTIQQNGTIILDEPEIHLHPEWQLLFAELIVLIQKEFGMHVLLNTHSPYFLRAIEVYSAKHEIANKCNYYLAETKGGVATFKEVNDNVDAIYKKLSKPFQDLENKRFEND